MFGQPQIVVGLNQLVFEERKFRYSHECYFLCVEFVDCSGEQWRENCFIFEVKNIGDVILIVVYTCLNELMCSSLNRFI